MSSGSSMSLLSVESSLKSPDSDNGYFCLNPKEVSLSSQGLTTLLKAVLEKGKPFRFCASGHSMSPLIKNGDVLTVRVLKDRNIKIGEVVAYTHPTTNKLLVHRVIKSDGHCFSIKADRVKTAISDVAAELILGITDKVERDGRIVRFGLGFERIFISFLTRHNLFMPLIDTVSKIGSLNKRINFNHRKTQPVHRK